MSRNKAEEDVSVVSFISSCLVYINGIQFGLLIENQIKCFSFCIYFRSLIEVKEQINKERGLGLFLCGCRCFNEKSVIDPMFSRVRNEK
jgi:hypothetical protein